MNIRQHFTDATGLRRRLALAPILCCLCQRELGCYVRGDGKTRGHGLHQGGPARAGSGAVTDERAVMLFWALLLLAVVLFWAIGAKFFFDWLGQVVTL